MPEITISEQTINRSIKVFEKLIDLNTEADDFREQFDDMYPSAYKAQMVLAAVAYSALSPAPYWVKYPDQKPQTPGKYIVWDEAHNMPAIAYYGPANGYDWPYPGWFHPEQIPAIPIDPD